MSEQQQDCFIRRVYSTTALVAGVVSVGLMVARQWRFVAGFAAGVVIAAVMIYGVVLVSNAMTQRGSDSASGQITGRKVVAVQLGKYGAVIAILYVLINFTAASGAGIAVGYGTTLAVLLLMAYWAAPSRAKPHKDSKDLT